MTKASGKHDKKSGKQGQSGGDTGPPWSLGCLALQDNAPSSPSLPTHRPPLGLLFLHLLLKC